MTELSRQRRGGIRVSALVLALVLTGVIPAVAQSNFDLELRGGAAIPAGDLAEVGATGAGFGAGVGWWVSEHVALRLDGDLEILSENALPEGIVMPRAVLWHYHAGLEVAVPMSSAWRLRLRGGGGGTTYDTELFYAGGDDFLDTYFSVSGGASLGRQISQNLELGVTGQVFVVFTDEYRTQELSQRSPVLNPFSKASSFPVQLYLRWTPPR
jgi:hypothetical protein